MAISQKIYYNPSARILRTPILIPLMNEASFLCRCRRKDKIEGDGAIKRKLIQAVFFHKRVIRFGQRFIAGKVLIIDSAFNTNKLRMPSLLNLGVINSG